ncbi:HAMP domain-containing protein [Aliikangiella marina]|uniref:histidine kinase n=1 Tax=Aliikangiella marina TaxID=1712262 RepID=A0A545TI07_9GAMM|nr:ATP-binding protein [Aliikangiella marina]TQV76869.1 HAMP domain-containing protein [Aliikangiella marina]
MNINPLRWQLKTKFISILLVVLLIPIASVVLLKEVEKTLVDNLKQNLLLTSKLYSLQLESNSNWFYDSRLPDTESAIADELFVFPLQQEIVLDGFFDEWEFLEHFRANLKVLDRSADPDTMGFLMGAVKENLYLSFQITDEHIIYWQPVQTSSQESSRGGGNATNYRSELIVVSFIDNNNIPQRIFIKPIAPGKIPVEKISQGELKVDWRYSAYWVETADGFNVEVKFPNGLMPTYLQVRYFDVDKPQQTIHEKVIASSLLDLNPVVWPSASLDKYVKTLTVNPGQRVWVLDTKGRVMARHGDLRPPIQERTFLSAIADWIFAPQISPLVDHRSSKLRLSSPVIQDALTLGPSSAIESELKSDFSVALAASPIIADGQVLGAVMIEENVARVQFVQRKTLSQMLYVMGAIIFGVIGLLGWYVSKLVGRISKLRKQVTTLVDEQGRMRIPAELDVYEGDEIDELNKAFVRMGNKLYDYHDYLEKLASRLSHELRTPIAVVRSSLDNLLLTHREEADTETIKRALVGTERLGEIITRMRQASGVKEAMQSANFEEIDLTDFLTHMVAGFQQTFKSTEFKLKHPDKPVVRSVSPDLLAEMMDKLLSNAIDFSQSQHPVIVELVHDRDSTFLNISNTGPLIEKKNLRKIFQSLVSIRDKRNESTPNLGLGLYVVRLIAEFHGAKVKAANREDATGVVFSVIWRNK